MTRPPIAQPSLPSPRKSRGAALLLFLLVVVIAFSTFLLSSYSTVSLDTRRQQKTLDALAQAKEALIGRAASDINRPGSLPCPDVDGNGSAEIFNGNECQAYIGRLPWKTLGLPELRDGDGERLWYALSPKIRDNYTAQPINSEESLELNLDDEQNIAAIIFSPGPQLSGQNTRPSNNAADYLDGINRDGNITNQYVSKPRSETFNDQVLAITRSDVFRVVNKRILGEVRNLLFQSGAALPGDLSELSVPAADSHAFSVLKMLTYNGWIPPPVPLPAELTTPTNGWPSPTIATYQLNGDGGTSARITIGTSRLDIAPLP